MLNLKISREDRGYTLSKNYKKYLTKKESLIISLRDWDYYRTSQGIISDMPRSGTRNLDANFLSNLNRKEKSLELLQSLQICTEAVELALIALPNNYRNIWKDLYDADKKGDPKITAEKYKYSSKYLKTHILPKIYGEIEHFYYILTH